MHSTAQGADIPLLGFNPPSKASELPTVVMGKASKKQGQKQCSKKQGQNQTCDVPACEHATGPPMVCCGKHLCRECAFGVVDFDGHCCHNVPHFSFKCPFCRDETGFPEFILKRAMAEHCPSHAKVMDKKSGGQVVVAHRPCPTGCYTCEESTIVVREL